MSDPRAKYESVMDAAIAVLGDDCRKAYQAFEQTATVAWYDYQIRTSMIPVPRGDHDETEQGNDEGIGTGSAGPGPGGQPGESTGSEPDIYPAEVGQGGSGERARDTGAPADSGG